MKKKLAIGLGILALAGAGAFIFLRRKKKADLTPLEGIEDGGSTSSSGTPSKQLPSTDFNKIVTSGSRGAEVKSIQKIMNSIIAMARKSKPLADANKEARRKAIADFNYLSEDGIWGKNTQRVHSKIMGIVVIRTSVNNYLKKQKDFRNLYQS